jgi:hypothetical protein
MSGLVGLVSNDAATPIAAGALEDLTSSYELLRGAGTRRRANADGFAGVTRITANGIEDPPFLDRESWALICGSAHGAQPGEGMRLESLDGQFVWSAYDAPRRELSIATDPFGMRSLYVAEREGATYFSTCALALAKHLRARPSAIGVTVFLRAGFHFGTLTNWEGIERLDPGTRIRFTRQGPKREVYWQPSIDESVAALGFGDAVEHCLTTAAEVMRGYYAGKPRAWSDLTGGWDTRLMTAVLAEVGVDFVVNTVGAERDPDVRVAERVARAVGWEWTRFEVPPDWKEIMPRLVPLALAWGDGNLDALQLAGVLWGHRAKVSAHRTLFTGGGGEHFRDRAWQQEFFRAGRSQRVNLDNYVDMRLLKPLDTTAFAEDPTPEARANMRERMAARAAPYASHLNTTQLDVLHAYKNTGHFGAYLSASAGTIHPELPFYLKEVFTAPFSTNYRHRGSHRLMRHMIDALDPRLAAVETEAGGPAQPMRLSNGHRFLPYYATLARRAAAKLSQRGLPRPILTAHTPPDLTQAEARAALVQTLDEGRPLRHKSMRSAPLFARDAVNDLLARAGDPNLRERELLGRVLTVELALRTADASVEGYTPRFARRGRAAEPAPTAAVDGTRAVA